MMGEAGKLLCRERMRKGEGKEYCGNNV